ncbi:MAG: fluoride efflux transporter CrcB [Phycisphaerae bacterium]|nr:fluoride efflux transporter CrcB [Phycisphaerae bacterium]
MTRILLIALGGGLGSVLRYLMAGWTQSFVAGPFPVGTMAVNVSGCLIIGFANYLFSGPMPIQPEYRIGLTIGLLGGYTTFSTFGWETIALVNDGQGWRALGNVLLSVGLGLLGVWLGCRLAQRWAGV